MSEQPISADVEDSPTPWVKEHIRVYTESGGQQGHEWREGVPTLLLSVQGRKSGTWHRTALIYGRDGADYVIVASKGGAPDDPQWYRNLVANPEVALQVGPDVLRARARTAAGDERARLWEAMAQIWPDYDNYARQTAREIPVVVLEPTVG